MNTCTKILSLSQLEQRSRQMRSERKSLVLTNGCFDLLHVGHVRYLEAARSFGDALAVAVNDDNSVRRLKGPGRPITPEADRATVLAALECVQYVVLFGEDTAEHIVQQTQPAVYAKGGDYSDDPQSPRFPVEGHSVLPYGGVVRIARYVPGASTSDIIRRLRTEAP